MGHTPFPVLIRLRLPYIIRGCSKPLGFRTDSIRFRTSGEALSVHIACHLELILKLIVVELLLCIVKPGISSWMGNCELLLSGSLLSIHSLYSYPHLLFLPRYIFCGILLVDVVLQLRLHQPRIYHSFQVLLGSIVQSCQVYFLEVRTAPDTCYIYNWAVLTVCEISQESSKYINWFVLGILGGETDYKNVPYRESGEGSEAEHHKTTELMDAFF